MNNIWIAAGAGVAGGLCIGFWMFVYSLHMARKRQKFLMQIKQKEQRIDELRLNLKIIFNEIDPYRKQMVDGTKQFKKYLEEDNEPGVHRSHIKANIAMEQVEGYMIEAEKLIDEIDKEMRELEEMYDGL